MSHKDHISHKLQYPECTSGIHGWKQVTWLILLLRTAGLLITLTCVQSASHYKSPRLSPRAVWSLVLGLTVLLLLSCLLTTLVCVLDYLCGIVNKNLAINLHLYLLRTQQWTMCAFIITFIWVKYSIRLWNVK